MGRPRQVLHAASYSVTRHDPNWDLLHSDILRPNGMIFHMGELLLKKVGTIVGWQRVDGARYHRLSHGTLA
ncbi:hypothetical protein E6O75_ATG03795 [Venturia nashicola]|uniref:Uncharacterized protein n=1 Tax=Venturia nashicola TaxID=86259 RepID=A0A4Z1PS81_9PEZI|nr:hypothetical protein E6O75_ATG03795 [Venturia nashicola]